jgi:hypothetical protein
VVERTYRERTKHLLMLDQRKADAAGGVVNALSGLLIIPGLSQKDNWNERLRVSIVERKPGGLDLDHQAMTGEKDVIRGRKGKLSGGKP